MGKNGLPTGFAQLRQLFSLARPGLGWPKRRDFMALVDWSRRQRDFIAQKACDGAAVLSAQADTFAGANVKEKASACSLRNDSVGWRRMARRSSKLKT